MPDRSAGDRALALISVDGYGSILPTSLSRWREAVGVGSTNYTGTFIQVADDCPVDAAEPPPVGTKAPTVAGLQYALISEHPYEFTSDEVLFEVYTTRKSIPADARAEARDEFFAKDQACLRASPLAKRYGWGIHYDADSRIALVPLGSDKYQALAADPSLKQLKAMRSKRA